MKRTLLTALGIVVALAFMATSSEAGLLKPRGARRAAAPAAPAAPAKPAYPAAVKPAPATAQPVPAATYPKLPTNKDTGR